LADGTLFALLGLLFLEHAGVHQPSGVSLANRLRNVLSLRVGWTLVKYLSPELWPDFSSDRTGFPFIHRFRTGRFQSWHEEPVVFIASRVQGGPRERIVVIADAPSVIGRMCPGINASRISQQHRRHLERSLVSIHDFALHFLARHQFGSRIRMPLAPGPQQTRRDETDSRITVIPCTQCGDEGLQCGAQLRVVVVGCAHFRCRKRCRIRIQPRCDFKSSLLQERGNAVVSPGVLHPDPEHGLVTARGDVVKQRFQRLPVEFVRPRHQVAEGQIIEFHAVRKPIRVRPRVRH